jgi:hypothetical protein
MGSKYQADSVSPHPKKLKNISLLIHYSLVVSFQRYIVRASDSVIKWDINKWRNRTVGFLLAPYGMFCRQQMQLLGMSWLMWIEGAYLRARPLCMIAAPFSTHHNELTQAMRGDVEMSSCVRAWLCLGLDFFNVGTRISLLLSIGCLCKSWVKWSSAAEFLIPQQSTLRNHVIQLQGLTSVTGIIISLWSTSSWTGLFYRVLGLIGLDM